MACFHPLAAYRRHDGSIQVLKAVSRLGGWSGLRLPCGQCVGCRLEYSRQWATRIMHEASMHRENVFVTLTYRDGECPVSLQYEDFRGFCKRLRSRMAPNRCRFFMCGEYGSEHMRPHFHACLFGVGFSDGVFHTRSGSGEDVYRSPLLESLWPHGFSSFGSLTFESAAYVARYVCKKVGVQADKISEVTGLKPYEYLLDDGSILERRPEFARMSLKPGLGAKWLEKFEGDVFPCDYVWSRGVKSPVPRYYSKVLAEKYPEKFAEVKALRENKINPVDSTPERLAVREVVTNARLNFKKRTLE